MPDHIENFPSTPFDPARYLEVRQAPDSFVMVEVGHGLYPVASEAHNLVGQRAYIGLETWQTRGGYRFVGLGRTVPYAVRDRGDQNIFFMNQELESDNARDRLSYDGGESRNTYAAGQYDPRTNLPDQAAHEVFLGNVFGVPSLLVEPGGSSALMEEVMRILDDKGEIVIKETIGSLVPIAYELITALATEKGLSIDAHVTQQDGEIWDKLESLYGTPASPEGISSESFYLFLSKVPAAIY